MLRDMFKGCDTKRPRCGAVGVAATLLDCLRELLASVEHSPEHDALARLQAHAKSFASMDDCRGGDMLADDISAVCKAAVTAAQRRRGAKPEIEATLSLIRQAADALATRQEAFSVALSTATARLQRVQREAERPEVKASFAEAISTLDKLSAYADREQRADRAALTHRLLVAEEQLNGDGPELIDPLTMVTNQRGFDLILEQRIAEFDPATSMVVALLDVDHLNQINERVGREMGDAVLKHVASAIRAAVRPHDVVARVGGDEFALIASGLTLKLAEVRLRRILDGVTSGFAAVTGQPLSVRAGAAEFSAGDTAVTLVNRAERALNDAKSLARQTVATRSAPLIRELLPPRTLDWRR